MLLAHQQIGEGIFQLGVHQLQRPGHPAHHIPIRGREGSPVDLFEQVLDPHGGTGLGPLELGLQAQAAHQLLQHFALLLEGGAAPQPISQFANGDVVALQLLLFSG